MLKLDKLIIKSFIGPFLLTTAICTFILLIQHMLKYFEDFVGKDLGAWVFIKLMFFFSLNMLQIALPLGVLVSSLMTFGNLGEHFELTAIKSSGISLTRALKPVFFSVSIIAILAFFFNNYILPVANLQAYSLLYDIKNKKPTLDINEGVFYQGLPNYTLKVDKKLPDDVTLLGVKIWDHTRGVGNRQVILADSCRMFTFMKERYLKLELFNGNSYQERQVINSAIDQMTQSHFHRLDMVFSLASFEFDPTDPSLFTNNRQMMDINKLNYSIDSLNKTINNLHKETNDQYEYNTLYFNQKLSSLDNSFNSHKPQKISPPKVPLNEETEKIKPKPFEMKGTPFANPISLNIQPIADTKPPIPLQNLTVSHLDSMLQKKEINLELIALEALSQSRRLKSSLDVYKNHIQNNQRELNKTIMEKYKKMSQAVACIIMFFIGAPLGAIIKKGGLGVPVIISVFFFIIYYVITMMSYENAEESKLNPYFAPWVSNIALLPIGLFFLRQARIDARLFDRDIYVIAGQKLMKKVKNQIKIGNQSK